VRDHLRLGATHPARLGAFDPMRGARVKRTGALVTSVALLDEMASEAAVMS
jgi:hypothetical protein